ncbi:MAG: Peptidase and subtilisin, kexin, sedolisin, partial [Bacteroidetes bacterium]|nr:Peptidase and subtilisin, kexin, sedolisin [Bacteroidota bacterium]
MNTFVKNFRHAIFGIALALTAGVVTALAQVAVTIPNSGALPGAAITIPVNVGDLTGRNVTAYEFEALCDSTIIRFTGIESIGTLSNGLGPLANYTVAPRGPGRMKVVCASSTPFVGSGVLIYLKATAQSKIGITNLELTSFLFNTGNPSATITNGSLRTNRAPTMTAISAKSVAEKDSLKFTATATDPDLPSDTHAFSLSGAPSGASITSAGAFTWVPDYGQAGSYSFRVKVTDLGNASDSTTVSVTVTHTNRKPTFTTKMADTTIGDGTAYSFPYAATDPDAATTLTYKLESGPTGATVSTGGLFAWTPSSAQLGVANIVVSVSDGALADTANAKITVIHVNRKPVFVSKLRDTTINQGLTLTFAYSATDPDAGTTVAYSLTNAPSGASISASGVLTFAPPAVPAGPYLITAVASDGALADTAKATVSINRKPVFGSRTPSSPTAISWNVATTFTVTASDPDGNPLTFTWKVNGATEKTGDNTFTRTFADLHGTPKTVTAVFADAGGLRDSTTWNFNITPVEDTGD